MLPDVADYWVESGGFCLALDDYPDNRLGFVLDKLSETSRYFVHPTDRTPQSPWVWRYNPTIWPAVALLLGRLGVKLHEKAQAQN